MQVSRIRIVQDGDMADPSIASAIHHASLNTTRGAVEHPMIGYDVSTHPESNRWSSNDRTSRNSLEKEKSPMFNVDGARARVLDAMRQGKWDIVDEQLTAYAAAIRAETRHQAIGEALDALRDCGGDDVATPVRDCLAAVERLR